uniref:Uncharacterized protein n=1 Tax=Oryza glumipatula TaxID=40148 RepID=A0A0E0A011_9ORYZ
FDAIDPPRRPLFHPPPAPSPTVTVIPLTDQRRRLHRSSPPPSPFSSTRSLPHRRHRHHRYSPPSSPSLDAGALPSLSTAPLSIHGRTGFESYWGLHTNIVNNIK